MLYELANDIPSFKMLARFSMGYPWSSSKDNLRKSDFTFYAFNRQADLSETVKIIQSHDLKSRIDSLLCLSMPFRVLINIDAWLGTQ
ncbi:hypothetical protein HSBAA_21440 [Vreelandella sulfidaeris]|uniref:Uncharacterized protein n=1 Tax=Vreelandella sulfidaeris TaxID=115553 RepID=A0A455U993_9GAMM|nr:hypothetical protein HSBAA_21440 [Halomonas sulfidaeris]